MNDRLYKLIENKFFIVIIVLLRFNRIKIDILNFINEKFFVF